MRWKYFCRRFVPFGMKKSPSVARPIQKRARIPVHHTNILLIIFTLAVTAFLYIDDYGSIKGPSIAASLENHSMANWNDTLEIDKDSSISCHVPRFAPFDKAILPFYRPPPQAITCKNRELTLSLMHLDSEELEILPMSSSYQCYVEDVLRRGDNAIEYGNSRQISVGRHRLKPHDEVQAIRVYCKNIIGLTVYAHIHLVPPKVAIKLQNNYLDTKRRKPQNVFIFGVDSVSRLAALRLLPKTYKFLVEDLLAVVLRSHHKVGENTFPNLLTVLSGERRTHPADTATNKEEFFDEWPLIWKDFSNEGYETLYAEDFPQFNTFNYLANGFIRPPTTHYLRPFWLAIEESMLAKASSLLCYGDKPKYQLQLDYLKYFLRKKRSHPYFVFSFLVEISHEYQEYVGAADSDFVEVLKLVKEDVRSGATLLIFLSDHGHRFDAIRRTAQGHVEERLPFVAIATASEEQRAMLNINSHLLTSHYDLHEVLRSVLPKRTTQNATKFGINILQSAVPKNRSCVEAGVLDVYCTCETSSNNRANLGEVQTKELATKAVDFINSMLSEDRTSQTICKRLSLKNVHSLFNLGNQNIVTFETIPGNGMFELRLSHGWNSALDETMFSRINRYGVPCISSQILRKYCYCDHHS